MNFDTNPDNTDSPIISPEQSQPSQPQQPTSAYNQFGVVSPEPASVVAPMQPQPIPQPAKKSRKKLIIGLIIAAVVASASGVILFANHQTAQAKTAASQYRKDVLVQLDTVTNSDNYKDRVAIWRKTAQLKNVLFGASLSKEYKAALDLRSRYESLITSSYPIVLDRYASTDLSPFLKDLQATLAVKLTSPATITPGKSTYSATLAANKAYVTALTSRATSFQTLAARAKTYVYPEKYRDSQAGVVTALENMSHSWSSMAAAYTTYIDEAEKTEAIVVKGDTNGLDQQIASITANQAQELAKIASISADYPQYTKALTGNESTLTKAMIADGWFTTSQQNILKVGEKVDLMRAELK